MEGDKSAEILEDGCRAKDDETSWLTEEESINASITVNLGCIARPLRMYFKNTPQSFGGTENFTIYLSTEPEGPFKYVAQGTFNQSRSESCTTVLHTFNMDHL